MRALLQRVKMASVTVDEKIVGEIQQGILVFLGVQKGDDKNTVDKLLKKILGYRLFADEQQKMNCSVCDINGGVLVVSQFTLAADTQKGLRPGFSLAAEPKMAEQLYDYFVEQVKFQKKKYKLDVATGVFGADMQVALVNDGPVTFLLEAVA